MAKEIIRPCAACKHHRRRCDEASCNLAPYFPADNPQRYNLVHSVFGRSKVSKILQEQDISHRKQVADSLVYQAEARLRDNVYGVVGPASFLEKTLKDVQDELKKVKNELIKYLDPEIIQEVLSNPDRFGFAPSPNQNPQGNLVSQQPPTLDQLTTSQIIHLLQLKENIVRPDTGINSSGGGGGEGQHIGAPAADAVIAPSFDNGSTSSCQIQLQGEQQQVQQQPDQQE